MNEQSLPPALLTQLAEADTSHALRLLENAGLLRAETAGALTRAALEQAEAAPQAAAGWLAVAKAVNARTEQSPQVEAQIAYAQARLHLLAGDAVAAEADIRRAQALWQRLGATEPLARSFLGLTQVLAMQGRYQEAETSIQRAIVGLPVSSVLQAQARMNLANLLVRQERHAEALDQYAMARDIYLHHLEQTLGAEQRSLQGKLARLAVNQANALMYLDRPVEAEKMLQEALSRFQEAQDALNLGRTYTNLGVLHLRTGRYGDALDALRRAGEILVEDVANPEVQMERLRQADILLLEQANAFLALNLIPEAVAELERAIQLFQSANQPRELGQALYTLGMVHLHNNDLTLAHETLARAQQVFQQLEAPSWLNRVRLAQATLAYRAGKNDASQEMVAGLLAEARSLRDGIAEKGQEAHAGEIGPGWDLSLLVEVWLLQLRLHLEQGALEAAAQAGRSVAHLLAPSEPGGEDAIALMPHFRLQLEHALGVLSLLQGDASQAIQHFQQAIHLLERQRIRLPLEEFKTAYLEDKGEIYSDLVLGLLLDEEKEPHASIFAVTEQARARALLERIYAVENERETHPDRATEQRFRELRQQQHWLYNQLLEGGDPQEMAARRRELERCEAALRRLAWKQSTLLAQAQPVDLAAFQAALDADEQAVVYYVARPSLAVTQEWAMVSGEVMAMVIHRGHTRLFRRLASLEELRELAADLRFELGRVELGWTYFQRHRQRLMASVQEVLGRLYDKLIAPLEDALHARRLVLAPHDILHQLPLHCLWDGEGYLLERFECSYTPSASLLVHNRRRRSEEAHPLERWVGLAIADPAIPAAQEEVRRIAPLFPTSAVYLDEEANRAGFLRAAQQGDVLHVATHGLFRPDNPFFSALKLADGWVDVRELYRLPLSARLVVLSACESGLGRVHGGDEVIGLARGFLGAGAQSLVVSLWNVHDVSAADIMEQFYLHLCEQGRAAPALRAAQQAAIEKDVHPYFWAPFLVIG